MKMVQLAVPARVADLRATTLVHTLIVSRLSRGPMTVAALRSLFPPELGEIEATLAELAVSGVVSFRER